MDLFNIPSVSIACITYNQENYIKDAIEGFLMQKTTFPIEIIINDDASTDNTPLILQEYAHKYPNLIVPIFHKENQYSQGINPGLEYVFPVCKGKYIAICEGDDYWTDPYKLQKQVDFLENNPEYSLVHSDGDYYFTESERSLKNFIRNHSVCLNSLKDPYESILKSEYPVITCSVVFRKDCLDSMDDVGNKLFKTGDTLLWLHLARAGKFYFFEESMVTRNILKESVSHSKNYQKLLDFKKSGYDLCAYYSEKFPVSDITKTIMHEKFNRVILYYSYRSGNMVEAKLALEKLKFYAPTRIITEDILQHFGSLNGFTRIISAVLLFLIKQKNKFF